MAEEIPKQENIQADAKKVSTTKKKFPMLHQDNRKHVPGKTPALRDLSCDAQDSFKEREPTLNGFPVPQEQPLQVFPQSQHAEADAVCSLGRDPPELVAEPGNSIHVGLILKT